MRRPTVSLGTIVACFLTVAAVAASPSVQAGHGAVTGTVSDALTRTPIAGASVTISPGGITTVTNGTGVYLVTVPAGTVSLTVSVPNRPFQSVFGVVVSNSATTNVNFTLANRAGTGPAGSTGKLAGYVRNAVDPPIGIANAIVSVSPGGNSTATDANGRYELSLPVGTYTVSVSAATYETASAPGVVVSSQTVTTRDFSLSSPAASGSTGILRGSVRNADPNAQLWIAGAIVSVSPGGHSTTTDGGGRYELSLPVGTYTVSASAPFYETASASGVAVLRQALTIRDLDLSSHVMVNVLHIFASTADGENPFVLIQATDGDLYGMTATGGDLGGGTIFKMTRAGTFAALHQFAGDVDGQPAGLTQGKDGNFYGVTTSKAFKMTPDGTVTILHAFATGLEGHPQYGLIQGADGDFYGTTLSDGPPYSGTVFKMTPDGTVSIVHAFAAAVVGLLQGRDGDFYGIASFGGPSDSGTVFKMTPDGIVTALHTFTVGSAGAFPYGLIQATDGDFYGMTDRGGSFDAGGIFRMTPAGDVTMLHWFTGQDYSRFLSQATDGNFYGTTYGIPEDFGGGGIFGMTPAGAFAFLHSFRYGTTGGANPFGGLVKGSDGNLYGATFWGGIPNQDGRGTLFRLTVPSTPAAIRTGSVRNSTTNPAIASGSKATAREVFLPSRLNKTAVAGPVRDTRANAKVSTVAAVAASPAASAGQEAVTGIVTDAVTRAPIAGALVTINPGGLAVVTDGAGVYQTTVPAGTFSLTVSTQNRPLQSAFGVVVKNGATTTVNLSLANPSAPDPQASPKHAVFQTVHVFTFSNGGDYPDSLIQATDGYFYGTTFEGGNWGFGTVFKMTPDGSRFTVLHTFTGSGTDGAYPLGLIQAADGDFYVVARTGYPWFGAVFKMTSAGDVTIVREFREDAGDAPNGLIQGTDGDFYGTTLRGGPYQRGTVFKMTPDGVVTLLHGFSEVEGAYLNPGVIQATDGNFYGTTYYGGSLGLGTVFTMTPAGIATVLHEFTGGGDGFNPDAGLIRALDGNFYGTTSAGTIFTITPTGDFTTLHSFLNEGPPSRLVQGVDGNFYGTTFGDDTGRGSIFRMTPAGAITILHSFAGTLSTSTDGSGPIGGLVQGTDGSFYGLTVFGGSLNQSARGTVFRLRVPSTPARPVRRESGTVARHSSLLPSINGSPFGMLANGRRWDFGTARRSARPALPASAAHSGVWEIEGFGGATFTSHPTSGTGTLPPAGVPFNTATGSLSRHVSSWYLGDGAQLLNGVSTALGVSQQITPLDAALNASVVERPSGGGGFRVSRIFTPRLTAEFTVELSAVRGALSSDASAGIEASRTSFLSAWQGLASAGQFADTALTSVRTEHLDNGHQLVATGAINVALKRTGKVIPYITGGVGVSSHSGTAASAGLTGDYRFSLSGSTPFHETDSVNVRYTVAEHVAVGVLGAGFKYLVSPHVGFRFDYRTYLGPNRGSTFVDSKPVVSTLTPAGSGASATTPGIQFSNDASIGIQSSLSGPTIADFRTFTGSGMQRHARLTIGLFWRF